MASEAEALSVAMEAVAKMLAEAEELHVELSVGKEGKADWEGKLEYVAEGVVGTGKEPPPPILKWCARGLEVTVANSDWQSRLGP